MSECEHEFIDCEGIYLCINCGTVVTILGFIPKEDDVRVIWFYCSKLEQ